jgi:hypothetical protein
MKYPKILSILLILLPCFIQAQIKVQNLPTKTTNFKQGDNLIIDDSVGGSGATKKISIGSLKANYHLGSLNPTSFFLPYNNGGVFQDSWFKRGVNNIFLTDDKQIASLDSSSFVSFGNAGDGYSANIGYTDPISGNGGSFNAQNIEARISHTTIIKLSAPIVQFSQIPQTASTDTTISKVLFRNVSTGNLEWRGVSGSSGTVTSVTSANGNATVATTTTTPVITIVSAPKLETARTINGTSFDGTGNITVTSAAGTLTGTTLNSTVTGSSLTSVGTLANLTVTNPISGSITGNAATVTTNANLTGDITSVGNATTASAGIVKSVVLNTTGVLYTSPVTFTTTTNTATGSLALSTQTANTVLAGATSGGAATPTFRALVAADIPSLTSTYEVPLTFSTGLTRSTNTITNNLSVGVSGGQTVIGGTAVGDGLILKGTTANGTTTASAFTFNGGNNGATQIATFLNNGNINIGNAVANPAPTLGLVRIGQGTSTTDIGQLSAGRGGIWFTAAATPDATNYTFAGLNSGTYINVASSVGDIFLNFAGVNQHTISKQHSVYIHTAATSGNLLSWDFTAGAHTGQTAGADIIDVNWKLNRVVQHASNTLVATQRAFIIQAPTYSFVTTGGAITDAVTFEVTAAPIQGTNWNSGTPNRWAARLLGNVAVGGSIALGSATGTVAPSSVALIDAASTTQGVLFPRMTTTQKNAITAVEGLVVYDLTLNKLSYYNGTTWTNL